MFLSNVKLVKMVNNRLISSFFSGLKFLEMVKNGERSLLFLSGLKSVKMAKNKQTRN